jgi:hypothetical protein
LKVSSYAHLNSLLNSGKPWQALRTSCAMNGRNVLDYMKLVPGVAGLPDLHQSGTGSLADFSINGTRQNQPENPDRQPATISDRKGAPHISCKPFVPS